MAEQHLNTINLSDTELKALSEMVRQSKLTVTAEELVLVKLGRHDSPIIDVTFKVASAWEIRQNELNNPQQATSTETSDTNEVSTN